MAKGWFSNICRNVGLMVHNAKNPNEAVVPEDKNESEAQPQPEIKSTTETVTSTELDQKKQKVVMRKTTTTVEEIELPLEDVQEKIKKNQEK